MNRNRKKEMEKLNKMYNEAIQEIERNRLTDLKRLKVMKSLGEKLLPLLPAKTWKINLYARRLQIEKMTPYESNYPAEVKEVCRHIERITSCKRYRTSDCYKDYRVRPDGSGVVSVAYYISSMIDNDWVDYTVVVCMLNPICKVTTTSETVQYRRYSVPDCI